MGVGSVVGKEAQMHGVIRYAVLATAMGVGVPGVVGAAGQTTMTEYKYEGETFEIQQVYEGVYEVSYKEVKGLVGVTVSATADRPYGYSIGATNASVDGLSGGNFGYGTVEEPLRLLCRQLMAHQREIEGQRAFDRKKASEDLQDFFRSLP